MHFTLNAPPQAIQSFRSRMGAQISIIAQAGQDCLDQLRRQIIRLGFRLPGFEHPLQASNYGAVVIVTFNF